MEEITYDGRTYRVAPEQLRKYCSLELAVTAAAQNLDWFKKLIPTREEETLPQQKLAAQDIRQQIEAVIEEMQNIVLGDGSWEEVFSNKTVAVATAAGTGLMERCILLIELRHKRCRADEDLIHTKRHIEESDEKLEGYQRRLAEVEEALRQFVTTELEEVEPS